MALISATHKYMTRGFGGMVDASMKESNMDVDLLDCLISGKEGKELRHILGTGYSYVKLDNTGLQLSNLVSKRLHSFISYVSAGLQSCN